MPYYKGDRVVPGKLFAVVASLPREKLISVVNTKPGVNPVNTTHDSALLFEWSTRLGSGACIIKLFTAVINSVVQ